MKLVIQATIFIFTYLAIAHSDPNPKKAEIIEAIIAKQAQENYEEAINGFIELGKLGKNQTLDLSLKEQKLYFHCYEYRRKQLLNAVVDSEKYLNKDVVEKMLFLFGAIESINQDLDIFAKSEESVPYYGFNEKVTADKLHFEAWYTEKRADNSHILKRSSEKYYAAYFELRNVLGNADITALDACMKYSSTKIEYDAINNNFIQGEACTTAVDGLSRGQMASSRGNPDLVPLTSFIETYCKTDPPNILEKYEYKKRE